MHRRNAIKLLIPSLLTGVLYSCGKSNDSLNNSSMWYPAPSMSDSDMELKVRSILSSGKRLKFNWDCGGDEAIVYLDDKIDKSEQPDITDQEFYESLTLYIMNFLNLPDVGEFSMNGGGEFKVLPEGDLMFEFESILNSYIDYNPDTKEVKEVNDPKVDTMFTGKKRPF